MEYILTFGRNPELSLLELKIFLNSRNIGFKLLDFSELAAVLELPELDFEDMISKLGGTLKIARVIDINNEELYSGTGKKIKYGISVYSDTDTSQIKAFVKKQMKSFRLKAMLKSSKRSLPFLSPTEVLNFRLTNEGFELVVFKKYIGKTIALYNPKEIEKRDLTRPKQRPKHMISIRLARILINLSGAVEDSVLLDPFCGYGILLQEAMLMGLNVFGIDRSYECVNASEINIRWLKKKYNVKKRSKIVRGDSQELSKYIKKVDYVATEPYMGPLIKKLPTKGEAIKILKELEPMYLRVLKELKKVVRKNIVIIAPRFRLYTGQRLSLDFDKLLKESRLKAMRGMPLIYTAPKSKMEREIWILST
ncbi:MAG: hypothetical protein KJ939_05775 [Nanoarchaeota archaeon]|nr:hypothetical protein [Nanoarchaeota archaeon]MBU4352557.1 hypothetical protein [Nanoarchaeota archaeon]